MCSERVALMWSMSEASVVDLPEPVGPVTRTSPRGLSASASMCCGSPSSESDRISVGIIRKAAPRAERWKKTFTRRRPTPGIEYAMSMCRRVSSTFCCSVERIR